MHKKKSYLAIPEQEKLRSKGFVVLKEYKDYYLCGKEKDDEILYRECFSKFDVDGVKGNPAVTKIPYDPVRRVTWRELQSQ